MKRLLLAVFAICLATSVWASTLYGLSNAYVACDQVKMWQEGEDYIFLESVASVDPLEQGTYGKVAVYDTKTHDSAFYYLPYNPEGLSDSIVALTDAELSFEEWIADHLVNYANVIIISWVELDIADVPDYFSWGYINDEENGPIDTSLDWWVDWDATGPRFSNSRPTDFGKWMWDGSINPSWVEPVAPLQRGKHLALGHGK